VRKHQNKGEYVIKKQNKWVRKHQNKGEYV